MSKHRAETQALTALADYQAAAEHLATVAGLRSPTKLLSEALERFRGASERLRNPVRDLRPAADAFTPADVYMEQPRSVVARAQDRPPFMTKFGG